MRNQFESIIKDRLNQLRGRKVVTEQDMAQPGGVPQASAAPAAGGAPTGAPDPMSGAGTPSLAGGDTVGINFNKKLNNAPYVWYAKLCLAAFDSIKEIPADALHKQFVGKGPKKIGPSAFLALVSDPDPRTGLIRPEVMENIDLTMPQDSTPGNQQGADVKTAAGNVEPADSNTLNRVANLIYRMISASDDARPKDRDIPEPNVKNAADVISMLEDLYPDMPTATNV